MSNELLSLLEAIERDKGIDREVLIQAIESGVATAAKKSEGVSEEKEAVAVLDRKSGRITVTVDGRQISSASLTRIAAQVAKQVILQKFREAEREVIFTEFQGRVGDIVTGSVHRFERGDIIVELGRAEAVLPKTERIPHEEYHQSDRLQGFVLEVRKNVKGPAIVLSRTHEDFIRGLFKLEVPEIAEGIVEIKGIAREAGDRTKIAVWSKEEKVDCVGACVGMRGSRVKNIVRELHGEKVDIIRWHPQGPEFIAAALSPAKIAGIEPIGEKDALVLVDDDQLSLAIGKKGQNVRLASKLTGWQLEIKSRAQLAAAEVPLDQLPGVGPTMLARLTEAGVTSVAQLAKMTVEQLTAIKGVGERTAQKLLEAAQAALAAKQQPAEAAGTQAPAVSPEASPAEAESPGKGSRPTEAAKPTDETTESSGKPDVAPGEPPANPETQPGQDGSADAGPSEQSPGPDEPQSPRTDET